MKNLQNWPSFVSIMEVGPRDGLQNEKAIVSTREKISFINSLSQAGFKRIEVTAFVSPKWIPPLADQMEVAKGITRYEGVSYAALVPNLYGYERAKICEINEVSIVLSASETHNNKNINATTKEAIARYKEVALAANKDNRPFRAYLSCAFGCPYEKAVSIKTIVELCEVLLDMGAYEISLSDTISIACPKDIFMVLESVLEKVPAKKLALHLHDTFGGALANILAGLQLGISSFDSSAGGMGGCPYAKGALGNVASEDLLYMLHKMGIETGISLEKLCLSSLEIEKNLQRNLNAKVLNNFRLNGLNSEK